MSTRARLDGVVLDLSSGYRSYDYQDALFKRHVRELGLEQATRESAEPGKSQHQLGTTIDFGSITPAFARTDAGRWLSENAWRYGFSLSYPRGFEEITGYMYESWHFRYLGRDATLLEREFFGGIQQTMLVFLDQNRAELERARS
jgi:D-alanyl-D-alanine carboxypeptidase